MRAPRATAASARLAAIIIVLSTLLGGAARLVTVTWGSPFLFHPDERGFVMWEAAGIEWRGLVHDDWRPRTTTYGPLMYELAIGLKWTFLGGIDEARREAAQYGDEWAYVTAANERWREGEPFSFLRWTHLVRAAGAIGSALAILLMGLAAWRLSGPRAGAITAVLTASSAGLVQASHYATTDSLLIVQIAMLLHASALLARARSTWPAIYAGLALGAMAATKMTGLLLLAVVPIAIASSGAGEGALRSDRAIAWRVVPRLAAAMTTRRFVIVVVVMLAVYAVLCPWAIVDRDAYFDVPEHLSGRGVLLQQYRDSEYGFYDWRYPFNGTPRYLYQLTHVLPYALGVPVMLAGIAGLLRGLRRDATVDARIALAAALPTFLLVGSWGVKTIRYALPIVPGLVLAAGVLLARALDRGAVVRAIAALVLAAGIARGVAFTGMFLHDDPRVLAGRWLLERLEPGDTIVVDPEGSYTAPLGANEDGVGVDRTAIPGVRVRRLWQSRPTDVPSHVDSMLRDARFVVVGELYRRRGMHPESPWRAPAHARFYRALFDGETGFELVATFPRAPSFGPFRWDESDAEAFAVAFDHMPVYVFERRGEYRSPFAPSR
ncbi:glycosyltransferase family 39 protein [Sandaracinus amylolyticus]|uniref:Uncharacterized protein n=1 Tax=Sandaracinus amylolyticus TaxID=927083 RepID=A0A0F6YHN3_9BACT|nr:glycosyltransferase family 39 protein [Sandaracinus amylolyticus]AKF05897.1 Hypothetical protein DB32_003046 [Sandaracinus amylolyticus]